MSPMLSPLDYALIGKSLAQATWLDFYRVQHVILVMTLSIWEVAWCSPGCGAQPCLLATIPALSWYSAHWFTSSSWALGHFAVIRIYPGLKAWFGWEQYFYYVSDVPAVCQSEIDNLCLLVSVTCYHSQKLVPSTAQCAELWHIFIHSFTAPRHT